MAATASSSKLNGGGADASGSTAAPSPTLYVKNIESKVKKPGMLLSQSLLLDSFFILWCSCFIDSFSLSPLVLDYCVLVVVRIAASAVLAFLYLRTGAGCGGDARTRDARSSIYRL